MAAARFVVLDRVERIAPDTKTVPSYAVPPFVSVVMLPPAGKLIVDPVDDRLTLSLGDKYPRAQSPLFDQVSDQLPVIVVEIRGPAIVQPFQATVPVVAEHVLTDEYLHSFAA